MDGETEKPSETIFQPGATIPAKCGKCGADFQSTAILISGFERWRTKWCAKCVEETSIATEQEEKDRTKRELLDLRKQEWREICPPLYRQTDINHPSINQKALREAMEWKDAKDGVGLAIRGESGKCKTRIAYLVLEKLFMAGACSVAAISATRLASLCADIYNDNACISSEAHKLTNKVRRCSYLLIDDLGKQKFTERAETELYDLIETRTSNLKPTFWTANVTSDAFAKMMSEDRATPIIRRLSEFSKVISL